MAREIKVSKTKKKAVEEIANALKNKRAFIICSIQNLPSSQFQEIKKKLKDRAKIKVLKKNIIIKGIEASGKKEAEKLYAYLNDNVAVLYSDLNPFEVSGILADNKSMVKAKTGQQVEQEIAIKAGPTDIPPGPAISEFGALGIKVAVEGGKIVIKQDKVLLKAGDKVDEKALAIMSKLSIMPFEIGLEPIAAYDSEENRVYAGIKINKKETIEDMTEKYSIALAFAVSIEYECEETIGFLIAKASAEEKALASLIKSDVQQNSGEEK